MSLLSSEPEKGHAFIQFYLTYLEKNPDDYTAKNMFALYSSLFTYFESEEIHVDGIMIRIESIFSLFFYDDKGGSTIHVNIGVIQSELEPIKRGLSKYIKIYYFEDVIAADPSFGDTPFEFKADQMTEVLGPLLTVVEMIIIIVVVICTVILACGITIFLILIHKRRIIKPSYPKIDWHKVSVETNSAEINQKPINILG